MKNHIPFMQGSINASIVANFKLAPVIICAQAIAIIMCPIVYVRVK